MVISPFYASISFIKLKMLLTRSKIMIEYYLGKRYHGHFLIVTGTTGPGFYYSLTNTGL